MKTYERRTQTERAPAHLRFSPTVLRIVLVLSCVLILAPAGRAQETMTLELERSQTAVLDPVQ